MASSGNNPKRYPATRRAYQAFGESGQRVCHHRRIEILELLAVRPELCVSQICETLQIEIRTASEHLRRLVIAGLVLKRYEGREVKHVLTDRALNILKFLDTLG